MVTTCKLDGCVRSSRRLGLCVGHYRRLKGALPADQPLSNRARQGEPLRFVNAAVSYGGDDCLIWPFALDKRRYASVRVAGRTLVASRYVCTLVHGEPPTPAHHAAHACNNGSGGCVNPRHLSWKTVHENAQDRAAAGTCGRGKKGPVCKLNEQQVHEIRRIKGVEAANDLAARYGMSLNQIWKIQRHEAWAWLPEAA